MKKIYIIAIVLLTYLNCAWLQRVCQPPDEIKQIDLTSKELCQIGSIEMLSVPRDINPGLIRYQRDGLLQDALNTIPITEENVVYPKTKRTFTAKVNAKLFAGFLYKQKRIGLNFDFSKGEDTTIELDLGPSPTMKKLTPEEFDQRLVLKQTFLKDKSINPNSRYLYDTIIYSDKIKYKFSRANVISGEASINLENLAGATVEGVSINTEENSLENNLGNKVAVLYCKTQITPELLNAILDRNKPSVEYGLMLQDNHTDRCGIWGDKDGSKNHLSHAKLVYGFELKTKNFPEKCEIEYSANTTLGFRGPVTNSCIGEYKNNIKSISAKLKGDGCPNDWHIKYNRNYRPATPNGRTDTGKGEWRHASCDGNFTDDEANAEGKIVGLEFRINPTDGCL